MKERGRSVIRFLVKYKAIAKNNSLPSGQHRRSWPRWVLDIIFTLLLPFLALLALFWLVKAIKLRQKSLLVLSLLMLAAAIAGSLIYWRMLYSSSQQGIDAQYKYSYQQLDDYKLDCVAKSQAMSFKKPIELVKPKLYDPGTTQQVELIDLPTRLQKSVDEGIVPIGSIKAACLADQTATDENYLKNVASVLGDAKNPSYETFTKPLHQFIQSSFYGVYNSFNISSPKPFTSISVKDYAWQLDFTASVNKAQNAGYKVPTKKGKMIYGADRGVYYYFMVDDVEINWQPNNQIWQQVIDSLKINQ